MNSNYFSVWDYVVFFAMFVFSALIGLYYAWKSRGVKCNQEFLSGKQDMGVVPITISLVASIMSAITVLGMPAEVYSHSIQYSFKVFSALVAVVITDLVFLPVFYELRLPSVNKYLQKRCQSNSLRIITTLSYIIGAYLYLGPVLYGPALALSSVTPLSINLSIVASGIVCTFYTTLGGMKAVVWADNLQMLIMACGMFMVIIQGTIQAGGIANVFWIAYENDRLQFFRMTPDLVHDVPTAWEVFFGLLVLKLGSMSTNQICVQRYCSVPTFAKARMVLYFSFLGMALTSIVACICGVVIFANYYNCDPLKTGEISKADQIMPHFVMKSLGHIPGLTGFFVAAVFSGSLSTISSVLNAMTILTWNDLVKRFCRVSKTKEMIIIKAIGVIFGLLAISLAYLSQYIGSVLQTAISLSGSLKGPLLAVFGLAVLCPFINSKGLIAGLISGQSLCLIFNLLRMAAKKSFRSLPTSVEGCLANTTVNFSYSNYTTTPSPSIIEEEIPWILRFSPFFIPFVGNVVSVIVGIAISLATGGADPNEIDPKYLSKFVRQAKCSCLPDYFKKGFCLKSTNISKKEYLCNEIHKEGKQLNDKIGEIPNGTQLESTDKNGSIANEILPDNKQLQELSEHIIESKFV